MGDKLIKYLSSDSGKEQMNNNTMDVIVMGTGHQDYSSPSFLD